MEEEKAEQEEEKRGWEILHIPDEYLESLVDTELGKVAERIPIKETFCEGERKYFNSDFEEVPKTYVGSLILVQLINDAGIYTIDMKTGKIEEYKISQLDFEHCPNCPICNANEDMKG